MASTRNLRRRQQQKASLKRSKPAQSASEGAVSSTTSANLPVRRVSDPDITADIGADIAASHQRLLSNEDASIASSSACDDEASIHQVVTIQQFDQSSSVVDEESIDAETSAAPSAPILVEDSEDTSLESSSSTPKEQPKTSQNRADDGGGRDTTNQSFEDLFQKWHANRVVKRTYPSVKAFPSLKPFDGFHETNTAEGGYTFGPYFDRWYAKQQERAGELSSSSSTPPQPSAPLKRPNEATTSTEVISLDVTPRVAKKLKTQNNMVLTPSSVQQQRNLNSLHKWNAANALYRSKIVELPESFVPGPYTVIMGRRLKAPGCVHLRSLTDRYAKEYKEGSNAMEKSRIVTNILKKIYDKAPTGAFVRCKAGQYYEVEDLIAREKIVSELIAGGLQLY